MPEIKVKVRMVPEKKPKAPLTHYILTAVLFWGMWFMLTPLVAVDLPMSSILLLGLLIGVLCSVLSIVVSMWIHILIFVKWRSSDERN